MAQQAISTQRTVTAATLKQSLKVCISAKLPVFIHGPSGAGKSSVVAELCKEMGGKLYDMRLSQSEQTDLKGIPYYNKELNQMCWAPPIDLPSAEDAAQYPIVFLFLDEMNSAPPSVLSAAYQLVLDRKVGTYQLPDNVVIIAAGNRESDRGVIFRMPAPLSNRFVHLEMRVDFDSWFDWAIENRINKDIVGFLTNNKNHLHDFDPQSSSKSFATPRSWEYVSKIIDIDCPRSIASDIIAGTIGDGVAMKFMAHCLISGLLPSVDDILTGKDPKLETEDISAHYSLVTSLCYELSDAFLKADKKKTDPVWISYADNVLSYIVKNMGKELQVVTVRIAMQKFDLPLVGIPAFTKFKESAGKLVMAA